MLLLMCPKMVPVGWLLSLPGPNFPKQRWDVEKDIEATSTTVCWVPSFTTHVQEGRYWRSVECIGFTFGTYAMFMAIFVFRNMAKVNAHHRFWFEDVMAARDEDEANVDDWYEAATCVSHHKGEPKDTGV